MNTTSTDNTNFKTALDGHYGDILDEETPEEKIAVASKAFEKVLPLMKTMADFHELRSFQDEFLGNAHEAEVYESFLSLSHNPSDVLEVYTHLMREGAHLETILEILRFEPLFALVFRKVHEFLDKKPE